MAGIERYDRKVGTDPSGKSVDFRAPQIEDAGPAIRGLGKSLLKEAEPILAARAAKRGDEDAGAAPIVRDEAGRLKRAEPLPGGGVVYRENFMKAANTAYSVRVQNDAEALFTQIQIEDRDNPQAALAKMQAHRDAVLDTTPPDIRPEIEGTLDREMMQRFNGLASEKASRDRKLLSTELNGQFDATLAAGIADLTQLADANDFGAFNERLGTMREALTKNQDARVAIGELGEVGRGNEDLGVGSRLGPLQTEVVSLQGMQGIIARASEFAGDRNSLEMLAQWTDADPTGGKGKLKIGIGRDDYVKQVPSQRVRQAVANWANGALSDLNRLEADAAADARAKVTADTTQKLIDAFTGGTQVAGDEPLVQKAIDTQTNELIRANGGNVTQWMLYGTKDNPNAGVQHLTGVIETYGFLPTNYRGFLESQIDGTNGMRVAEVMLQMQTMRGAQGQYPGRKILRSMPAHVRAKADYLLDLAEAGVGQETALTMLEKKENGQLPDRRAVYAAFPDEKGLGSAKVYYQQRDAAMVSIFGELNPSQKLALSNQIDSMVPSYIAMYGPAQATKALEKAVRGVSAVWAPSEYGMNGLLPAELTGLKLTPMELDLAVGNYVGAPGAAKGSFPNGGAFGLKDRFGNPRARIELANDDTPVAAGLGAYRIWYYNENGDRVGPPRTVNIDAGVKQVMKFKGDFDARLREAARTAAIERRGTAKAKLTRQNDISNRGPKY